MGCKTTDSLVLLGESGKPTRWRRRACRAAAALPLWPADDPPKNADRMFLAVLSSDARLLLFSIGEVPTRANGGLEVQLIALPQGITLSSVTVSDGTALTVT